MQALSVSFTDHLKDLTTEFEKIFKNTLDLLIISSNKECSQPSRLIKAMHYAVFNGGKRLRPALVYATGSLFALPSCMLHAAAMAVELIHCYSLVHDDLP